MIDAWPSIPVSSHLIFAVVWSIGWYRAIYDINLKWRLNFQKVTRDNISKLWHTWSKHFVHNCALERDQLKMSFRGCMQHPLFKVDEIENVVCIHLKYHSIMCVTIAETERLEVVPFSIQPFATTLVTSSCSGPHAMLTTTSDTRWVMPDSTMSTDHT